MILKMKLLMLQHTNVIKYVFVLLLSFVFGCKSESKKEEVKAVFKNSISGLLKSSDTTSHYNIGLKKLSEYGFFKQPLKNLEPAHENIIPYDINSPLFTDYASKKRFIALPDNKTIAYTESGELNFPNGTILIKNFYYQGAELQVENQNIIIETRLLIKAKKTGEWKALPYVWNEDQTEAYLYILGKDLELDINIDGNANRNLKFTYTVPNSNMCNNCHIKDKEIVPLGPTARQLNRTNLFNNKKENQLAYLKRHKKIHGLKDVNAVSKIPNYADKESASLNERARAYLDVNCAHCHRDGGSAKTSGLHLTYQETEMYRLGLNKPPVAAGKGSGNLSFDIVAGKPEASILLYRMKHLEPDIVMPEIGKNTLHEEGIKLIEEWIASL